MKRSYVDLVVEAVFHDFKRRKVKARQKTLFSVMRDGLLIIAKKENINPHHFSAYNFSITAASQIFEHAKDDVTLSIEARADARQVLYALKGIRHTRLAS